MEQPFIIWTDLELELTKSKVIERVYLVEENGEYFYNRWKNTQEGRKPEPIKNLREFLVTQAMMMTTGVPYIQIYKENLKETHCYATT